MGLEQDLNEILEKAREELDTELRIALIGQPGAGKSSLINQIMGKKIFETGVHTDTTSKAEEARLDKMYIVDLPGYGTNRFPFHDWVNEFQPQNYDLYLFVFNGKLHESDAQMFQALKEWSDEEKRGRIHPLFIVRNFSDSIWDEEKTESELRNEIVKDVREKIQDESVKVYFTSCGRHPEGIDDLKDAIINADIPGAKKSKFISSFRAKTLDDLKVKRSSMQDSVKLYAIMGVTNAIPIPGSDIIFDLSIIYKMCSDIRETFGIDNETESKLKKYQIIIPTSNTVFQFATKEGTKILVEKLSKKCAGKMFEKFIPFVGPAVAATSGCALIWEIGNSYIDDCYDIAKRLMEKMIENEKKK
ncbi:GTPase [Anaerovibrio sp.]|uniref:GTPase family protein n=1 Tax=Anaerovibrio sp. TaxID=1872532 RepID=UPI0025C599AC|nr:GTPase [Anaerovibrio sp.]MBR2142960.1 50S ribosome-binding GTPase [Anaerovibrio sp.]